MLMQFKTNAAYKDLVLEHVGTQIRNHQESDHINVAKDHGRVVRILP